MQAAEHSGYFELLQASSVCGEALLHRRYRSEDRVWRSEDRSWREQDVAWRDEGREWRAQDMKWRQADYEFMVLEETWRVEDMKQVALDNARLLWSRFVERNRRDVEERTEQLRSVAGNSALLAGFALTAFLQFSFDADVVWPPLLAMFGLTTALVVGMSSMAMVTCTLMLASIIRSGKEYVTDEEEGKYLEQCFRFIDTFEVGQCPPAPARTFQEHWNTRCERDWQISFKLFIAALVAFILNLALAAWIWRQSSEWVTPTIFTATLAVALAGMLAAVYSWAGHLFFSSHSAPRQQASHDIALTAVKARGLPFDWHRVARKHGAEGNQAPGEHSEGRSHMSSSHASVDTYTFRPHPSVSGSSASQVTPPQPLPV